MSIEVQIQTISVPGAQLVPSGNGYVVGLFADGSMSNLYGVFKDSGGAFAWKRIDITNVSSPAVYPWTPTDTSNPATSVNADQNCFFFEASSGYAYGVFPTVSGLCLLRLTIATGLVEYATKYLDSGIYTPQAILGVAVNAGVLVALVSTGTATALANWTLSSIPSWSTALSPSGSVSGSVKVVSSGTMPVPQGICLAADGNVLVFFDPTNSCTKYTYDTLLYSGSTGFISSDVGVLFNRNGFIYHTNALFSDASHPGLVIHKWLDRSTAVISQETSVLSLPDRIVQIGENTSVPITYQARDGFGAVMTPLAGLLCRFTIVTNRGVVDADDAAISESPTGPFRDADDIPIKRQVDVAFNGSAVATAYFQSARKSVSQSVIDTIRVVYPAQ